MKNRIKEIYKNSGGVRNDDEIVSEVLQTVYKEIKRKLPKEMDTSFVEYDTSYEDGENDMLLEIKKIIKQIMEVEE